MSRISAVFADRKRKALVLYLMMGYPSDQAVLEAVPRLAAAGCDIVELGVPFSDPLADGATIQEAAFQALKHGATLKRCLRSVADLRKKTDVPIVLMGYFNPVLNMGLEKFCAGAARAGANGLIVPDLPVEEGSQLETVASGAGLDLIYLVAPTSTDERIKATASHSRGFLYLVSVAGVTGARTSLPAELEGFVARVRRLTDKPLCVGFGISGVEQAVRVARVADGVIIGSRVVQLMAENKLSELESLVADIRRALDALSIKEDAM